MNEDIALILYMRVVCMYIKLSTIRLTRRYHKEMEGPKALSSQVPIVIIVPLLCFIHDNHIYQHTSTCNVEYSFSAPMQADL